MRNGSRRFFFSLGALLIAAGWSATQYARDSVRGLGPNHAASAWIGELPEFAGTPTPRKIAIAGYIVLSIGAAMFACALPRDTDPSSKP